MKKGIVIGIIIAVIIVVVVISIPVENNDEVLSSDVILEDNIELEEFNIVEDEKEPVGRNLTVELDETLGLSGP